MVIDCMCGLILVIEVWVRVIIGYFVEFFEVLNGDFSERICLSIFL